DCRSCKKGKLECPLNDGMKELYIKMVESDLLIFGTPVYWYGPTAKMKLLVDRMRPFIANKKLEGKKAVVVSPSEEGAVVCGPMLEMFKMSFKYIGVEYTGELLVSAYEKGEIKDNTREMKRAFEFGKKLG
ncbi:MAG: flavodoxin family protein, partial [Candidatus Hodarchaeota archaeon]